MKTRFRLAVLFFAAVAVFARVQDVHGQAQADAKPAHEPDVIFVATPANVVDVMLAETHVTSSDIVYDLGSGDGRILIAAAQKYGARGVGIEIDPALVRQANENAAKAGVADKVRFVTDDIFTADFSEATVVTMYLLQSINERLRPRLLRDLKPGTRIVSHVFNMGPEWPAEKTIRVGNSVLSFYTITK